MHFHVDSIKVFRCVKSYKPDKLSVSDDACLGRPKTFITEANNTDVAVIEGDS